MDSEDAILLLVAAPATAYREYLYRPRGQLARWIGDQFEVVARPGQRIGQALRQGDVLLEIALGRVGPGRCVTLAARDLELVTTRACLAPGRLVLRPRKRVEMTEPLPVEPAGESDAGTGAHETASDVVPPFPEAGGYLAALATNDEQLKNCAGTAANDPGVNKLCGTVADVSGDPPAPAMCGLNSDDMLYVGSLAKLYALYVAFELRLRVEAQAKNMIAHGLSVSTAGWEQNVFTALRIAWQPQLTQKFPGFPPGFPQLEKIFTLSANGDVSFREHRPALTDADIDTIGESRSPDKLPRDGSSLFFRDWMRLMLRWSNNAAASRCILALSYPYINGALMDAGFFDPYLHAGLWLSGDYESHDWLPANRAGQPLTPRWATAQRRPKSNFTATSYQLARFMTLLARGRLIDSQYSEEMRSLLNAADGGIGSYVHEGLAGAAPPRLSTTIRSKIGMGDDGFSHDAAIVYVTNPDPSLTLTYVSVALGSPPPSVPAHRRADLHKLVVKFHDCVIARHSAPNP